MLWHVLYYEGMEKFIKKNYIKKSFSTVFQFIFLLFKSCKKSSGCKINKKIFVWVLIRNIFLKIFLALENNYIFLFKIKKTVSFFPGKPII